DESSPRDATRAPAECATDLLDCSTVSGLTGHVHVGDGLSALDAVTHLRVEQDARAVIDRVAFLLAARAEAHRRDAHLLGVERRDVCRPRRAQRLDARGTWQTARVIDHPRVAALRRGEVAELAQPRSIVERLLHAATRAGVVAALAPANEHLRRRNERELREVGWPVAAQRRDRLRNLERVADGVAERLLHVGELARHREAMCDADR